MVYLSLGVVFVAQAKSTGTEIISAIDHCIISIKKSSRPPKDSQKLFKVNNRCANLRFAINAHPLFRQLNLTLEEKTNLEQLRHIKSLFLDIANKPQASYHFNYKALDPILADTLQLPEPEKENVWTKFKKKLAAWIDGVVSRFSKKLGLDEKINLEISDKTGEIIWMVMVILVLLIAAAVIANEFRFINFKIKRGKTQDDKNTNDLHKENAAPLSWKEIQHLLGKERVSAVFNFTLDKLSENASLPNRRSHTNGELRRSLASQHHEVAHHFTKLINSSEGIIYGSVEPKAAIIRQIDELAMLVVNTVQTQKKA